MRKIREGDILRFFAGKMIRDVRDMTIEEELKRIKGEIKGEIAQKLAEKISILTPDQMDSLSDLIIDSVDGALNNFLWVIEQEEKLDLVVYEDNTIHSVKKISGDLCIDYWDFVEEFSCYKSLT